MHAVPLYVRLTALENLLFTEAAWVWVCPEVWWVYYRYDYTKIHVTMLVCLSLQEEVQSPQCSWMALLYCKHLPTLQPPAQAVRVQPPRCCSVLSHLVLLVPELMLELLAPAAPALGFQFEHWVVRFCVSLASAALRECCKAWLLSSGVWAWNRR